MKDEEKKNPIYGDSLKVERNDSLFFVPFVHSLHIEISLNLSVFLRDSLSENTSFTSFTVTTVKDVPHLWIRHNNREQAHTSADCANRYSLASLLHANVPNAFWP